MFEHWEQVPANNLFFDPKQGPNKYLDLSWVTIQILAKFCLQKYGQTIVNQLIALHNVTQTMGTQFFDWMISSKTNNHKQIELQIQNKGPNYQSIYFPYQ